MTNKLIILLVAAVLGVLVYVHVEGKKSCDLEGGVYLTREMQCVAPPPGRAE